MYTSIFFYIFNTFDVDGKSLESCFLWKSSSKSATLKSDYRHFLVIAMVQDFKEIFN